MGQQKTILTATGDHLSTAKFGAWHVTTISNLTLGLRMWSIGL